MSSRSLLAGRWARRVVVGSATASVAWAVTIGGGSAAPAVLPDTSVEFSLDMDVVATADAPLVWVVEQRARPDYRIFQYDPATGEDETVFTVPEDAIIYGIDVDASGQVLAIAYSPDHALGGSGIWTLDLTTGDLDEVVPVTQDVYLTEPEWSTDGASVFATRVDRRGEAEQLDVVAASLGGAVTVVAQGAVTPAVAGDVLHYLDVDIDTTARQVVRSLDLATGEDLAVASGDQDLDHLVADDGQVAVAALEVEAPVTGLTFGAPAQAHGSHDVPSTWWGLDALAPYAVEPTTTYDASMGQNILVLATREGLSIVDGGKVDLIASRALRFVTVA